MSNCPAHSWEPFDSLHNRCRNCGALVSSAAGDELSRLRAENEQLRVANGWVKGKASQLANDNRDLRAENERLKRAVRIVAEQAEDDGLWFIALSAPEAYLQQELRRLHAAIEGGTALGTVKERNREANAD